jgi:hypothetical protein
MLCFCGHRQALGLFSLAMKQITTDQAEQIADMIFTMTESELAFATPLKITLHEAKCWTAYYLDEAAANDPVIVEGVRDGFNSKTFRKTHPVRRMGRDGKMRTVNVTIP